MMMMCRKESHGRMDKHEVQITFATCFFFFYPFPELFTDLCLSPGFTIRENPPRAFVCARACVCHYSLFQASRAAGGVERAREE